MSKNQCKSEHYHGAVYYERQNNDAFKRFLEGDIEPLVTQINQEQYNHLYVCLESNLSLLSLDDRLDYFTKVISQIPSVTHLDLNANLTMEQATQFAYALTGSNICHFELERFPLVNSDMQQYINALSDTKVTNFLLAYAELDDVTIDSMSFACTTFSDLDLFNVEITEYGFTKLIQSTYGSTINGLLIDSDIHLSPKAFEGVDFAKTNITDICFSIMHFQKDTLAHLNLSDSQVEDLYLYDNFLTADNLHDLSRSLQESNVKLLNIVDFNEPLALSELNLQGSNIETLQLHIHFNDNLGKLDLTNSNVKTLDLSYNRLTDEHLKYLNLKNTNVEHLILDFNNAITEYGIEIVKELIKDTHVIDASISTFHYNVADGSSITKEFVLHNEHILPVADDLALIAPKAASEPLAFSDIIVQSPLQSGNLISNTTENTLTSYVDLTPIALAQNPLGVVFEQEICF